MTRCFALQQNTLFFCFDIVNIVIMPKDGTPFCCKIDKNEKVHKMLRFDIYIYNIL